MHFLRNDSSKQMGDNEQSSVYIKDRVKRPSATKMEGSHLRCIENEVGISSFLSSLHFLAER